MIAWMKNLNNVQITNVQPLGNKNQILVVTVELIWLLFLNILFLIQLCLNAEQVS